MKKEINKKDSYFWNNDFDAVDVEMQRYIQKFDDVTFRYEARWGIGRLEKIVDIELQKKWALQIDKINTAIQNRDIMTLPTLIDGAIRGYDVLEKNASLLGHSPNRMHVYDVEHPENGNKYRFVMDNHEAHTVQDDEYCVITLKEVVRLLDLHFKDVFEIKKAFPKSVITETFDFSKGDDIPF